MKAYTDLEQSKKLAEILPIGSNDMYYEPSAGFNTHPSEVRIGDIKYAHPLSIPCWSLAALLDIIPYPTLTQEENKQWVACSYPPNHLGCVSKFYNNPIDACVAMIEKLHEQNLLKN